MQTWRYAGFWPRLVADIIDSWILAVASWILQWILLALFFVLKTMITGSASQATLSFWGSLNSLYLQVLNAGLYFCLAFPYYVWGHYRWGTTLGKRLFKIFVVREGEGEFASLSIGQAISRFFAYGLSYLPLGAGYLMAAFHPQKKALHDLVSGTVSIQKTAQVVN